MSITIGIGKNLKITPSTQHAIPFYSQALFWLDGTFFQSGADYYFEDKTHQGRHFLITGIDFSANYFPYKSAATISAPIGDTVLIAADINNFLYDLLGNPNQIPVVSLFQDIDYENKLFCRHVNQVIDVNGVEIQEPYIIDIVLYKIVLSGIDLTRAYEYYGATSFTDSQYWVDPDGSDVLGTGTKANPWATVAKAVATVNDGKTIYVKSNPNYPGTAGLNYIYDQKNNLIFGIGRAYTKGTAANYGFRIDNILVTSVKRIMINPPNAATYAFLSVQTAINTIYEFILIDSVSASYGGLFGFLIFKNSVLKGNYTTGIWHNNANNATIETCIFSGTCAGTILNMQAAAEYHIYNSKFTASCQACINIGSSATLTIVKGCTFNSVATQRMIRQFTNNSAQIIYNIFNVRTGVGAVYDASGGGATMTLVKNNKIDNTLNGIIATLVKGVNTGLQFEGNIIDSASHILTLNSEIDLSVTIHGSYGGGKILNNKIFSKKSSGYHIKIGGETSGVGNNDFTNNEINGNYIQGFDPTGGGAAQTTHGLFIGFQSNGIVKYNNIIGSEYGSVIKGTTGINGAIISYNIFRETKRGIYIKGQQAALIYNNTIICKSLTMAYGIDLSDNIGGDNPDNCEIKNNLVIALGTGNNYMIRNSLTFAAGSNVIDHNFYYCPNGTMLFNEAGTDKSWAEWQALGFDTNSMVLNTAQFISLFNNFDNNDFSLKLGCIAIGAGESLGAAYDDGLDELTDWGNNNTVPSIITKQQAAAWDIGAYIH